MKKGLTVFAISTLLCGGLAIADGGHQAFAKGGKGSSSSSSSHSSSRGSSSHGSSYGSSRGKSSYGSSYGSSKGKSSRGSSYGSSKRSSSNESLFDSSRSLTYGKSRGRSSFGSLSNRSSRVGTSSKVNNRNRYSNGIATRTSNLHNNLSNRSFGSSRNITNSRFGKTRTYGKTTFTNLSNRNTKNIGSNNIVTKNFRSNFVTRRGAGLHKNRTRNNIVISNKTLQNNRHNQTQLNVVSPNVSKFRSRIFRGQNMTFYRTNNNQLIQLPNENQ